MDSGKFTKSQRKLGGMRAAEMRAANRAQARSLPDAPF